MSRNSQNYWFWDTASVRHDTFLCEAKTERSDAFWYVNHTSVYKYMT